MLHIKKKLRIVKHLVQNEGCKNCFIDLREDIDFGSRVLLLILVLNFEGKFLLTP